MAKHKKRITGFAVLRTLMTVFTSLVIGISVYSWNAKSLLGNKLPMPMGFGMSIVLSGSMEPELSADDLVLIKECDSYSVNDIVVYHSGSILVIHRIVGISGTTVITKGDANNIEDDPIDINDIKGKMILKIPCGGYVVRKLKSPAVIMLMLSASVILIELSWRKDRRSDEAELKKIEEEIEKLKSDSEEKSE